MSAPLIAATPALQLTSVDLATYRLCYVHFFIENSCEVWWVQCRSRIRGETKYFSTHFVHHQLSVQYLLLRKAGCFMQRNITWEGRRREDLGTVFSEFEKWKGKHHRAGRAPLHVAKITVHVIADRREALKQLMPQVEMRELIKDRFIF